MIKLVKLQEPDVLRDNKVQWTQEYKDAKATKDQTKITDAKQRYQKYDEIKQKLLLETHEKCAYCESKMRHVHPGEIEHMKPASDNEDDAFEWENLTLVCHECNHKKNDYEGMINPYKHNPADHLVARGYWIVAHTGDKLGQATSVLLDRADLVVRRKLHLENLQRLLELYAIETVPILKLRYKKQIEEARSEAAEYTMVSDEFVKMEMRYLNALAKKSPKPSP